MSVLRFITEMSLISLSLNSVSLEYPKTEEDCISTGGHWTVLGLPYPDKPKVCDIKATDYGKECRDREECEGICKSPENALNDEETIGSCSEYILNYGNVRTVESGRVTFWNVD